MRGSARDVCSPPPLTDLRRAVLNPTDPYSVSFVKKSDYRDAHCRLGHLAPYSTELPTDEGTAEMNKVRPVQDAVSEANRNCQDKGQINTQTRLALTVPATDVGGSK